MSDFRSCCPGSPCVGWDKGAIPLCSEFLLIHVASCLKKFSRSPGSIESQYLKKVFAFVCQKIVFFAAVFLSEVFVFVCCSVLVKNIKAYASAHQKCQFEASQLLICIVGLRAGSIAAIREIRGKS